MLTKEEKLKRLADTMQSLGGQIRRANELPPPPVKPDTESVKPFRGFENFQVFFPDAVPLCETFPQVWKLTTSYAQNGEPAPSGVRLPTEQAPFSCCDFEIAGLLNSRPVEPGALPDHPAFVTLDVETSFLEPGQVAPAFLVGIGYLDGDIFLIDQFFIDGFDAEAVLLEHLAASLTTFQVLITFNGKTFDWPLLLSRFQLHGITPPEFALHLDLLQPARQLWKGALESCRLTYLEEEILGVQREGDVPGSLVPSLYAAYAQGIQQQRIVPVVRHNAQDIASTAALFPLLCSFFENPDSRHLRHRKSQMTIADWYRRAGKRTESLESLERAVLATRSISDEHGASMQLAKEYKKQERWKDALEIWEERVRMASGDPAAHAAACVEIARFYERQMRDKPQAAEWVRRALEPWRGTTTLDRWQNPEESGLELNTDDMDAEDKMVADLMRRLKRLEKKKRSA
jgi:uncharacterized protein